MKSTLVLVLLLPLNASCVEFIVPVDRGNSSGWPFTFEEFGIVSRRYQQVYDASAFSSIVPEGGTITHLFFPIESLGYTPLLRSVEIELSTTSREPDSLSPLFAENAGGDKTIVYGPSALVIQNSFNGNTLITFTQPFFYLPQNGNLLLDIRTFEGGPFPDPPMPRRLDAEDTLGDSVSAVMANDVNAPSGFLSTSGLITGFEIVPIPEPSTWALLGLGLFAMWRFSIRRNH